MVSPGTHLSRILVRTLWGHIILPRCGILPHTNICSILILDEYYSTCTTTIKNLHLFTKLPVKWPVHAIVLQSVAIMGTCHDLQYLDNFRISCTLQFLFWMNLSKEFTQFCLKPPPLPVNHFPFSLNIRHLILWNVGSAPASPSLLKDIHLIYKCK